MKKRAERSLLPMPEGLNVEDRETVPWADLSALGDVDQVVIPGQVEGSGRDLQAGVLPMMIVRTGARSFLALSFSERDPVETRDVLAPFEKSLGRASLADFALVASFGDRSVAEAVKAGSSSGEPLRVPVALRLSVRPKQRVRPRMSEPFAGYGHVKAVKGRRQPGLRMSLFADCDEGWYFSNCHSHWGFFFFWCTRLSRCHGPCGTGERCGCDGPKVPFTNGRSCWGLRICTCR